MSEAGNMQVVGGSCCTRLWAQRKRKEGMLPHGEIASALVLTTEEASGAFPRLCFADKGLLKAKAQVCCSSEAFLLLLRPPLVQRCSLGQG